MKPFFPYLDSLTGRVLFPLNPFRRASLTQPLRHCKWCDQTRCIRPFAFAPRLLEQGTAVLRPLGAAEMKLGTHLWHELQIPPVPCYSPFLPARLPGVRAHENVLMGHQQSNHVAPPVPFHFRAGKGPPLWPRSVGMLGPFVTGAESALLCKLRIDYLHEDATNEPNYPLRPISISHRHRGGGRLRLFVSDLAAWHASA